MKIIFNYINRNLNKYEINYIILDNLDIIIKKEYENNNYLNYYFKINLINILERRLLNEFSHKRSLLQSMRSTPVCC